MPESATKLEELVGEDKKYKTTEDLAVSRLEADRFIAQLQTETATLRQELALAITKADTTTTLEKLMTELANKDNVPPVDKPVIPPTDQVNQTKALTQDDIVKLLEARDASKVEAANLAKAMAEAQKVFGDKLVDGLAAKATELGMEFGEIEALAKKSPQAFFNLIGLHQRESSTRSMARDGRSSQQASTTIAGQVRNKAYYENLKQTMGVTKFIMDRDIQVQMHKDLMSDSWE